MGLFGFGKKKEWDIAKSDENKKKMRELFNGVTKDGDLWKLIYNYALNIKRNNYIIVKKTTYKYMSLIIGYRESDMSIAILQTTPEFDGCRDPEIYTNDNIKKAMIRQGWYMIYHKGGIFAGYTQFAAPNECDENYLAYIYQHDEENDFNAFFKKFMNS